MGTKEEEPTLTSTSISKTKEKEEAEFPLVVFPMMPPLMIPAFQKVPLLWMATPLTGMIENNKRRLRSLYGSNNVACIDAPTSDAAGTYEEQRGPLWECRQSDDVLLCLRYVTHEQCRSTTSAMKHHVQTKSKVHGHHKELRTHVQQEQQQSLLGSSSLNNDNTGVNAVPKVPSSMANPPVPKLCHLKGYQKGHGIFSVDNVHPNDEGYDFWGRWIAHGLLKEMKL